MANIQGFTNKPIVNGKVQEPPEGDVKKMNFETFKKKMMREVTRMTKGLDFDDPATPAIVEKRLKDLL